MTLKLEVAELSCAELCLTFTTDGTTTTALYPFNGRFSRTT